MKTRKWTWNYEITKAIIAKFWNYGAKYERLEGSPCVRINRK